MEQVKHISKKIFFPHTRYLYIFTALTIFLLGIIFLNHLKRSIVAYAIYPFTAYTLIVDMIAIAGKFSILKNLLNKSNLYKRYSRNLEFKAEISLYLSLAINLLYSFYKAFAGIFYHSVWFGTVAFYYIILSVERFLLLHHIRKRKISNIAILKRYCLCGYLLLILTIAIIGTNIFMIHEGKTSTYPGYIIYAAAGYTFYSFISAIINSIKYRKAKNPLYHANKMITLATAMVSVFSLQTAMFAEFGNDYTQQRLMNIITGFAVFIIIIGISLFMIIRGKSALKHIRKSR